MTDNKRTLYFMLSALGIAAVIALYTWLSGTDFSSTSEQTTVTAGEEVAQTIKNQIKALVRKLLYCCGVILCTSKAFIWFLIV